MSDAVNIAAKELSRLVRFVASRGKSAPLSMVMEEEHVRISSAGSHDEKNAQVFSRAAVDDALARGLVLLSGEMAVASGEASAFLRRALLSRETGFEDQHRDIAEMTDAGSGARYRVNRAESPLGAMARLKDKSGADFLPPEAFAAGERLHADFTRAGLQPRLTMVYEPRHSTTPKGAGRNAAADLSDTALAARERVTRAMEAIGPELCGVALDVCCFEKGLETVERERQWPVRSAKLMLRTALMALSRHYQPQSGSGRTAHRWGEDGYRPQLRDAVVTRG